MIYQIKHKSAIEDEDWTVEIHACNKSSAVAQVRWWFDVGRYRTDVSHKLSEYGFVRVKVAPANLWVTV